MNITIKNENVQVVNININGKIQKIDTDNLNTEDFIYDGTSEDIINDMVNNEYGRRKINTLRIEKAYLNLKRVNKAERLAVCWSRLEFFKKYNDKKLKLIWANSCRVRLCPSCSWRRSMKYYAENKQIFEKVKEENKNIRFLFLTLTVKNCVSGELKKEIDTIIEGFHRLMKYKTISNAVNGFIRNVEITYNDKENRYHPHIHAILAVNSNYFAKNYITQSEWIEMWQKACNLDYRPNLDIRPFKENAKGTELAEVSKYALKYSDILNLNDKRLTSTVETLDNAMDKKRMVGYGGILKQLRSELKFDDDISEDIEIDLSPDEEGYKLIYNWHNDIKKYIREI